MLASTRSWKNGATQTNRALHPRGGPEIVVFEGCVMEGLFGHVNRATGRVLEANGYKTVQVGDQQCCGALHAHAGAEMGARELARRNIRAFGSQPEAKIAVNSAGCGAMLKDYGRLLQDDPVAQDAAAFADRVFDVTELLAPHGPREGAPMNLSVAYDAPCHLQHAQKVVADSEALFNAIPGLEMIPHHEADVCCGGAGLYSMVEREMSREVLDRKIESVLDLDADIVATGNPGCIMQIGAGLLATKSDVRVVHPVELLDTSYRNAGFYE